MTVPGPVVRSTWWRWAFVALILIECAPIWAFRYVPTQDGPSHLDNAAVIANYAAAPIFREYYSLTLVQPAGNALAQIVLAGLLKIFAPLTAEKVFLTAYIVFFFLAFRYLLRALTPYADHFSCLAGVVRAELLLLHGVLELHRRQRTAALHRRLRPEANPALDRPLAGCADGSGLSPVRHARRAVGGERGSRRRPVPVGSGARVRDAPGGHAAGGVPCCPAQLRGTLCCRSWPFWCRRRRCGCT